MEDYIARASQWLANKVRDSKVRLSAEQRKALADRVNAWQRGMDDRARAAALAMQSMAGNPRPYAYDYKPILAPEEEVNREERDLGDLD